MVQAYCILMFEIGLTQFSIYYQLNSLCQK